MTPFQFGQHVRVKLAEVPAPVPTSSLTGKSTLPSTPATGTLSLNRPNTQTAPQTTMTGSGMPKPPATRSVMQAAGDTAMSALQSQTGQRALQNVAGAGAWYERNVSPETRQMFNDMSANSARAAGGTLSTIAGGVGALGSGVASGATGLWNAVTPKSMNTSKEWDDATNAAFKTTTQFAGNGLKDLYGSLGGDTDYNTQHSWNQLEAGFNDPSVDETTRNRAQMAGYAGHGLWNLGTAVSNPAKVMASAGKVFPQLANAPRALNGLKYVGRATNVADDFGATVGEMANAGMNVAQGVNQALKPTEAAANDLTINVRKNNYEPV